MADKPIITPESVRPALKLSLPGPWKMKHGFIADARGRRFLQVYPDGADLNAHDLAVMAPDLARAYLAEHARAEALAARVDTLTADRDQWVTAASAHRAEVDRLAAHVAELEAAAATVEWREGIPSVEDVRAHESRGGLWQCAAPRDPEWALTSTDNVQLRVVDNRVHARMHIKECGVCGDGGNFFLFTPSNKFGGGALDFRPIDDEATPTPWPVHASDTATAPDGGDCGGSDAD